jgi:hypothetical protein
VDGDAVVVPGPGGGQAFLPGRFDDYRLLPTGLDEREINEVKQAGLEPIGRIYNVLSLTPQSMHWELARLKEQGITLVIFGGEEVMGYRGLMKEVAEEFKNLGLLYGSVEFGKQRGDEQLSKLLLERMLRVHSISSAEMTRMPENEAVERYVRAPVERNIRVDYVRLPGVVTDQTYADNLHYVSALSSSIVSEKFGLKGQPIPLPEVWSSGMLAKLDHGLIGLGVGAAAVMLLAGVLPIKRGMQAILAVAAGLICAGLAASGASIAIQLVALAAAVVFPTLAFVLFPQPIGAFEEHLHAGVPKRSEAILASLYEFLAISAVTLAGALFVGGVLSELPFMVKVKSFAGIKVATVLPLLLVGWIYLTGMTGEYPSWREEREAMEGRLRSFFDEPIRVWHSVAILVGLAALVLLVMRSGNDPGIGVSETEVKFRALLDRAVGVRPRTKEFLLGHPALLLALAMAVSPRWRKWALPILLVGAIGQTGMLNSFCHLHSPLKLTVLRTLYGLIFGGIIGLVLVAVWNAMQGKKRLPREPLPG